MHSQTVEVASFARDVATERLLLRGSVVMPFFQRVDSAAADTDVIAHRHRQRDHRVRLKFGIVSLLEGSGQKLEEHPPERGLNSVDAAVEVALADHPWHVAVFVEEQASLVDVAGE